LYSDRHGIFRINAKDVDSGDGLTEFGRVTGRLGIEQICAHTPQAKGRVERANKTLQDRLIKEMRLAGIADMAAAQAFLPAFMARHNAQFAVLPRVVEDAHKPWASPAEALDAALALHEPRTLSKALTFSAGGAVHCLKTRDAGIAFRGAKVTVRPYLDGQMDVLFKDRVLPYTTVRQLPRAAAIADDRSLDACVDTSVAKTRDRSQWPGGGGGRRCVMWALRPAHSPCGGDLTRRRKGTSLLCQTRGHFYFALTQCFARVIQRTASIPG
jgi:hypothetical protein